MIVADSLEGGLGAVARAHASWFAAMDWRVVVAAPGSGAVLTGEHVAVPVPGSARDVVGMTRAAARLRSFSKQFRASVVHCHGARSLVIARAAGIRP